MVGRVRYFFVLPHVLQKFEARINADRLRPQADYCLLFQFENKEHPKNPSAQQWLVCSFFVIYLQELYEHHYMFLSSCFGSCSCVIRIASAFLRTIISCTIANKFIVVQYKETAAGNCMPITKIIPGITYVIWAVIIREISGFC